MAKLALLLATLALALFLANASIYRTTITLDGEENPWGRRGSQESSCEQQIRKQNYLEHCQKYIQQECSGGQCRREYYNPRTSRHLDSCCQQLEYLDKQCRCPGLRKAVEQQSEQGQMQELHQMVEKILDKCDVEPRSCEPRSWF